MSSDLDTSASTEQAAPYVDEHGDPHDGGVLRAGVFGVSDGLVSNLALVMGMAGGLASSETVVLAGVAGLLAGAFSMAVGEYVSVQTQREASESELHRESSHLRRYPEEEEAHLREMLHEAGLDPALSKQVAAALHREHDPALHFHALLELGINPSYLGSPGRAAIASFVAFVLGAAVPLLPWIFVEAALLPSIAVSGLALLAVGAAATLATGYSPWKGALRQLTFGLLAAGVTYAIGSWIGVALT